MRRVISGEISKMGILYERYKLPMYGYFFRLTGGDSASSEDLVHQVFLKAIRYKHSFKGDGSFASWLFSIAHNLGIDFIRIRGKKAFVEFDPNYHDRKGDYRDSLETDENLKILQQAIDMLPPLDREIILLGKIKELKYAEIGEITGLSESAVKTKIFRILKKLKDNFLIIETTRYERERN